MAKSHAASHRAHAGGAFGLVLWLAPSAAPAQTAAYSTIHDFSATQIGAIYSDLVADAQGRLVGTGVGNADLGTDGGVFRLTPPPGGAGPWTSSTIYTFQNVYLDGNAPMGGPSVVGDSIYGVNEAGGTFGEGTIFKLGAGRVASTLHDFTGSLVAPFDGYGANAGMVQGLGKRLYGTTMYGGYGDRGSGSGIVFSVNPLGSNPGYEVLHRFGHDGDGRFPGFGRLAGDQQGRLFGTTIGTAATYSLGTVFMLQRIAGHWQEQIIYSFGLDSVFYQPDRSVEVDAAGNLYGCAPGLSLQPGGVFKLAPPAQDGGAWTYSILYQFGQQPNDPIGGGCSVTVDPGTGRLFGVSAGGGAYNDGTIWEMDPPATQGAPWTETVLHSFDGSAADGANPEGAPFKLGNSYYGGNLSGIVYKFTPETAAEAGANKRATERAGLTPKLSQELAP